MLHLWLNYSSGFTSGAPSSFESAIVSPSKKQNYWSFGQTTELCRHGHGRSCGWPRWVSVLCATEAVADRSARWSTPQYLEWHTRVTTASRHSHVLTMTRKEPFDSEIFATKTWRFRKRVSPTGISCVALEHWQFWLFVECGVPTYTLPLRTSTSKITYISSTNCTVVEQEAESKWAWSKETQATRAVLHSPEIATIQKIVTCRGSGFVNDSQSNLRPMSSSVMITVTAMNDWCPKFLQFLRLYST